MLPRNVYAADRANALTGAARRARALVYVPNSQSGTLDVIDQHTFKVIAHYRVGALPQHVTPSYDLRTLYVDNDLCNSLTPIDPATGQAAGRPIPVTDPVQPLLHARRPLRDRRRRGLAAASTSARPTHAR